MSTLYFAVGCIVVLAGAVKWLTSKAATVAKTETENDHMRAESELNKHLDTLDNSVVDDVDIERMLRRRRK